MKKKNRLNESIKSNCLILSFFIIAFIQASLERWQDITSAYCLLISLKSLLFSKDLCSHNRTEMNGDLIWDWGETFFLPGKLFLSPDISVYAARCFIANTYSIGPFILLRELSLGVFGYTFVCILPFFLCATFLTVPNELMSKRNLLTMYFRSIVELYCCFLLYSVQKKRKWKDGKIRKFFAL